MQPFWYFLEWCEGLVHALDRVLRADGLGLTRRGLFRLNITGLGGGKPLTAILDAFP